jgi:hypothetical protein
MHEHWSVMVQQGKISVEEYNILIEAQKNLNKMK